MCHEEEICFVMYSPRCCVVVVLRWSVYLVFGGSAQEKRGERRDTKGRTPLQAAKFFFSLGDDKYHGAIPSSLIELNLHAHVYSLFASLQTVRH